MNPQGNDILLALVLCFFAFKCFELLSTYQEKKIRLELEMREKGLFNTIVEK